MDIVPFLNLQAINAPFSHVFQEVLQREMNRSQWILGDAVVDFEKDFAKYIGVNHVVGISNGLDALTLIWKSLIQLEMLRVGDQVLVPAHTYIASVLSILHAGLEPVLVDVSSNSYLTTAENFEKAITPKTKAILVVHLYGQMVAMEPIQAMAKNNQLLVIEDAAQAHGAKQKDAKAGSFGIASAFSFYPTKNLGALGDGGAVATNNEDLAQTIKSLSNYGSVQKYQHTLVGFNHRLDSLQAGFLKSKLPFLDSQNQHRIQVAQWYANCLPKDLVELPEIVSDESHVYHLFVVKSPHRDALQNHLLKEGIQTLIHYPKACTQHQAFSGLVPNSCPNSEALAKQILSLPMCPTMTMEQVEKVATAIKTFRNFNE